jgi:fatty acid-binding protein DegV
VTAVIGTILKIKPLMHVSDEGKLVPVGKAMGRKKSLNELVERSLKTTK